MDRAAYPVVVIGAGPVGLATAAHLLSRGLEPLVLERGDCIAASVSEWGHVRFFSPWQYAVDRTAAELLVSHGWIEPEPETYPTGRDLIERYLQPLAELPELRDRIRLNAEVTSVTRDGFDKMKTPGRENAPFLVTIRQDDGREEMVLARAVIDASGTWQQPNPLGASGQPAIGERQLAQRIMYGIPDVLGAARERYAGKRILVVGSGHSAFNVLLDLVELGEVNPETRITWAIRRDEGRLQNLFGGGEGDALPERGALGARVQHLVDEGRLRLVTGMRITRLTETDDGILVSGQDRVLEPVDEIIAVTGFRPDLGLLSELRLGLDSTVESPVALAPLIDPNLHSCGSVPPHGAVELQHPEKDFYIVGMKSYGRAPTFLMLTGYEQARSVVAAIAGDWDAAREVRLVLPETGVCSSSAVLADRGVGDSASCCAPTCCAPAPAQVQLVQLTVAGKERVR